MRNSFFLLVIYALAVFRICRFLIDDEPLSGFREWLRTKSHVEFTRLKGRETETKVDIDWKRPSAWLWKIITCYWCLSVWTSALVVYLAKCQGSWFLYVAYVLALSSVTGILAERI